MLRRYSASRLIVSGSNAPDHYFSLHSPTKDINVRYIELQAEEAGFPVEMGLARRVGSFTGTTNATGIPEDPSYPASTGLIDIAWSVKPSATVGTLIRRGKVGSLVGSSCIWTWPVDQPLVVPAGDWIVVSNVTSNLSVTDLDMSIEWEE